MSGNPRKRARGGAEASETYDHARRRGGKSLVRKNLKKKERMEDGRKGSRGSYGAEEFEEFYQ